MSLCTSCRWFEDPDPGVTAPTCAVEAVDPVDGEPVRWNLVCARAREIGQACGPEGKLHEARA